MESKIDASSSPLLPTSTSSSCSSSALPRPLAHVVLLLIDGVGDVPCKAFAAKEQREEEEEGGAGGSSSSKNSCGSKNNSLLTPLQAAAPLGALDAVASRGVLGLLDPVQPGKACGSDTAHLSLLGYDPRTYYRGRGAFESLGAGLSMEPGDIAFKCNFATLEEEEDEEGGEEKALSPTPLVVSRRADRAFEDAGPVLCSALDGLELPGFRGVVEVRVKYATEHRAGVVLSTKKKKKATENGDSKDPTSASTPLGGENGENGGGGGGRSKPFELSDAVSGTDPLKDNLPLRRCVSLLSSSSSSEQENEGGDEQQQTSEREEAKLRNAQVTAEIVNELSDEIRKILKTHPLNLERRKRGKPVANALLLRGCGARAPLPDFAARFGFSRACAVAPTKIIAGLALCAGFEVLECEGGKATGDYRTSLSAKVDAVVGAIEEANAERRRWWRRRRREKVEGQEGEEERRRAAAAARGGGGARPRPDASSSSASSLPPAPIFVLLHVKAVDDAGHDRAPFKKMAWLRAVDAALARLARRLGGEQQLEGEEEEDREGAAAEEAGVVVAVTGDHSTPVEFGDHSCEPVPFAAAPLEAVSAAAVLLGKKKEEGEIVAPSEEEMRGVAFEAAASASASATAAATAEKKEKSDAFSSSPRLSFDEVSASRGSLGRFPGAEVMPLLVRLSAAWGGGGGGGGENK